MNFLELRSKLLHWKITHSLIENEIVRKYGDIQAWYREYRNLTGKATEEEVNWFLTDKKIFRMKTTFEAVTLQMWNRSSVIANKVYWITNIEQGSKTLTQATILIDDTKSPTQTTLLIDDTKLTLPGPTDKEFVEQYEAFIDALEVGIPESKGFIR